MQWVTPMKTKTDLENLVRKYATMFGVQADLAVALIQTESNWQVFAVSPKGAMGLSQLMPKTAELMHVSDGFDPDQNLRGGMEYLSQLIKSFGGEREGVAAYNAGPAAVRKFKGVPPYKETAAFVAKIERRMGRRYRTL